MPTLEERFWAKVDRRGPDDCWPWLGSGRGYGSISVQGRTRRATHISWEMANGKPFPPGMCACHSCDNPPCVNPAHLWVGTSADNTRDMDRKGRRVGRRPIFFSERDTHCHRGHELTPENSYWRPNGRYRDCRACKAINDAKMPKYSAKLNPEAVLAIRAAHASGTPSKIIQHQFRIGQSHLSRVIHRVIWKEVP